MPEPLEVPVFTYGTYRSLTGEDVQFTDAFMRELARNTSAVIAAKALTPPVGYDEIDESGNYKHRGTDAHAHITGVRYRNGVLSVQLSKPSETFVRDVKDGRRLRCSGEFNPAFEYTDAAGKKVKVGPTIVGLAALGRFRPALKNPSLVPLSELNFGEGVSAADAIFARQELTERGFVAHHCADNRYAFSEIEIDPAKFEGETHMPMTAEEKAELKSMMSDAVDKATAPLNTKIDALTRENETLKGDVKKFSEASKRESATAAYIETYTADRKAKGAPLGKIAIDHLTEVLNDPECSDALAKKVKSFAENVPGAFVAKPKNEGGGKGNEGVEGKGTDEPGDEPAALSKLKPRHFADVAAHEALIDAGVQAFAEAFPDKVKGVEGNATALLERTRQYVRQRDLGDA